MTHDLVMVTFSSQASILVEGSTNHSLPALFVFVFVEVDIG